MKRTQRSTDTPERRAKNIRSLRKLFPEVFIEDKVDFAKLKAVLGEYAEIEDERYAFTWSGKAAAMRLAQELPAGRLKGCVQESKDWETTENLYIEGDNLAVLQLLKESYTSKVRVIYIDPPYNTGKDFVYADNFRESLGSYMRSTDEAADPSGAAETSGHLHTEWLNMIYPRLLLARELLRNDGLIFISIDDTEVDNLRKICSEIFGEENYITTFVWEKTQHFGRQKLNIYNTRDFIVCFAKQLKDQRGAIKELLVEQIFTDLEDAPLYNASNPEKILVFPPQSVRFNISDGRYTETADPKYTLIDPVIVKDGVNEDAFSLRFRSRWNAERVIAEYQEGTRYWVKTNKFAIRTIYPESRTSKRAMRNMIFTNRRNDNVAINHFGITPGTNESATEELRQLFGIKLFDYPKPTSLLGYLIGCVFDEKTQAPDTDCIVLDFFSGSGTTAEAVMRLNALDGGKRKFIMVQLPEDLDLALKQAPAGERETLENAIEFLDSLDKPHLLSEIGKERIRRAGEKIRAENPESEEGAALDIGFKVFQLDTSDILTR
ncbi:MAG TPA: site-specific DNA-methyltransferase [Sphaerochaeta sp.]|nr:site-specific DNA-methyltransferase [Sphaerochaeta sp.]